MPFRSPIKASSKGPQNRRQKYVAPSLRFLEWVRNYTSEKSFLGGFFRRLNTHIDLRNSAIVVGFALFLSLLLTFEVTPKYEILIGEVASSDVKAPFQFQIVDEEASSLAKSRAERSVPPVLDYDPRVYPSLIRETYRAFRQMRLALRKESLLSDSESAEKRFMNFRDEFEEMVGAPVAESAFSWLVQNRFSLEIERLTIQYLTKYSRYRIVNNLDLTLLGDQRQFITRQIGAAEENVEIALDRSAMRDLGRPAEFDLSELEGLVKIRAEDREMLSRFAFSLLRPNTFINEVETKNRRKAIGERVPPSVVSYRPHQLIVEEGTVVQPLQVKALEEIKRLRAPHRNEKVFISAAVFFVLVIGVFFSFLRRFTQNRVRVSSRDIVAMGTTTIISVIICKLVMFLLHSTFSAYYGSSLPYMVFLFMAPIAAGPMLVGLILSYGEVVWLYTVFHATALSFLVDFDFSFLIVAIITGIAGARGVFNCNKRNDVYFAGVRAGLVGALTAAMLVSLERGGDADYYRILMAVLPAAFGGGILSSLVTMMLIPLLETVFNYTTDVKLMELSNLNHPLLKEMVVKSPGTYHHSLVVGSMVEAAAQEIGANPLLARVMAYYHDIGKMGHSAYFIENQKPGYNPHDHLSPHMSKTILISHVKDGVELGLKHKLGQPIIDGIVQHHGTTLISYFYNKAVEDQDEEIDQVEEPEFRYPGPKPQFKESALIMLADSIEAAARSLDEPTPTRLKNIVKNIVQRKFMDGQLDECNLTLKDLSIIESSFVRTLLGIYHQRIDYPRQAGGGAAEPPRATLFRARKGANA